MHNEKIRQKLRALFSGWERDLIKLFSDAQYVHTLSPVITPESAVQMVVHIYECVMIRIRVEASMSPYDFLMQTLSAILF